MLSLNYIHSSIIQVLLEDPCIFSVFSAVLFICRICLGVCMYVQRCPIGDFSSANDLDRNMLVDYYFNDLYNCSTENLQPVGVNVIRKSRVYIFQLSIRFHITIRNKNLRKKCKDKKIQEINLERYTLCFLSSSIIYRLAYDVSK